MPVKLKYIAQLAMDDFNQSWADGSTFFDLQDFIYRVATTAAEFYQKAHNEKYSELRTDTHSGEVVPFDEGMLCEQMLSFKDGKAALELPVMSFVNDKSGVGYQILLPLEPSSAELERASVHEIWQLKYVPDTGRVFWYPLRGSIFAYCRETCSIKQAMLLYIPAVMDDCGEPFPEAFIPDGVADYARTTVVAKMKEIAAGKVVDKTNDGNPNGVIQSEINKQTLAG